MITADNRNPGLVVNAVADHEQSLLMLMRNRFDLVLATEASGDITIGKMKILSTDIVKLGPPVFSAGTYHYVHKSNESIIPKLEAAIRSVRGDGLFRN